MYTLACACIRVKCCTPAQTSANLTVNRQVLPVRSLEFDMKQGKQGNCGTGMPLALKAGDTRREERHVGNI